MFAKMGHQNISEAEVHAWCNADVDETLNQTTKGLAELFMRQASHLKELKNMSKENKIFKFKISQDDSDTKKIIDFYQLAMKQKTELPRKDLCEAKNKMTEAEKAREEAATLAKSEKEKLESELTALTNKYDALKFKKDKLEEQFKTKGQKIFMK